MRHSIIVTTSLISILGHIVSANAIAQSSTSVLSKSVLSEEQKQGLNSKIGLYIISGSGESTRNQSIDDENPTISSLDASPTDYDFSTLIPTLTINYGLSESSSLSLGIFDTGLTSNSLIENQSLVAISANKTFVDGSSIWTSLTPNISGLYESWQDPYLTGKPLQKTDASLNMLAAGAQYILGTPFSIASSIGQHHIDNDQAGRSLGNQLNKDQRKQLQRDTTFADLRLSATLSIVNNLYMEAGISHFRSNAEGNANSFDANGVDISLAYLSGSIDMYISAKVDRINFESSNPVFNRKREEDKHNIQAGLSYKNPFSWKDLSADFFVSTSNRDSNITFYDEKNTTLAVGLTYTF